MNNTASEIIATVVYDADEDGTFVVADVFTTVRGSGFVAYFVDEDNALNRIGQQITFYASAQEAIEAALEA